MTRVLQMRNETKKLNNLPKVTQLGKDKSQNSTGKSLTPKLILFPGKKLDVVSRRADDTKIPE